MAYTEIEEDIEGVTSEDIKEMEFTAAEMEKFEEESLEAEMEDDESDLVSEMESGVEEPEGAEEAERVRMPLIGRLLIRLMARRIIRLKRRLTLKLISTPRGKELLKKLCKRGPRALALFYCRIICRTFPVYLRPICRRLCLIICLRNYRWICRRVALAK
jgi:hypothetical protein